MADSTDSQSTRDTEPLSFLIKAAISALLLYLSLRQVNLESVGQRLGGLDLKWVALILLLLCAQMPLLAIRWRGIAAILRGTVSNAAA